MLSRVPPANKVAAPATTSIAPLPSTNSKMLHERLASDLSDSSTESGMMGLKKPSSSSVGGGSIGQTGLHSGGLSGGGGGGMLNSTNSSGSGNLGGSGVGGGAKMGGGGVHHQHDTLAVPEGFDSQRRSSAGMIKVKLASASPQWDNKAEVEVDCENPDEVVDKMLQSIVDKFPPTSVVTVEKGGVPVGTVTAGGGFVPGPQQPAGQSPRTGDKSLPPGAVQKPHPYMGHPVYPQQVQPNHPFVPNSQPPPARNAMKHSTPSSIASNHQQQQHPEYSTRGSTQGFQEVPKFVPKVEVREIVKEVPKVEVEWVEKIVEVPQISYVDKYEEVPQVHEIVKHVPKIETVDVPREVVKYVPKVVTKIVENVVEVPRGERVPVVRATPVDTAFVVPRFQDRNVPVVMSQYIIPEIEETDEVVEVEVSKYVPYLVPVDVYVPLPVTVPVKSKNDGEQTEQPCTNADPNLLQHLMIEMNPHLQQLELFNFQQQEQFQQLIHQSMQQARDNGVAPPQPIVQSASMPQPTRSPSANDTAPARQKSGISRTSSAGASQRRPSRNASRRVTGTAGGGATRGASQSIPPTTMMINALPPLFAGYPPMYGSGPRPPMMFQSPPPQYMPPQPLPNYLPPTLTSSQGFGRQPPIYNAPYNGSSGMAASTTGMLPPLGGPYQQPPQVNVVGPDGAAAGASGDRMMMSSCRKASRLVSGSA